MSAKAEKFSISFPPDLLAAVDGFVGKNGNRSGYFAELAEAHLRSKGLLRLDPVETEIVRVRELIQVRGIAAVKAKLDEVQAATLAEAS